VRAVDDEGHEQVLAAGVSNAGGVVRSGAHVLRPTKPQSASVHAFLRQVRGTGFDGVPQPAGFEADGRRERLTFIEGDAPRVPYPDWARADEALASVASLMVRFHRAAAACDPALGTRHWNDEIADPEGGPIVCHNDVCLENVVFRDGIAVALVDFDYCAPGRAVFDLAQCARMCVPIDDDESASLLGWDHPDRPTRLRLVCDAYGLDGAGRVELLEVLDDAVAHGGEFVKRHRDAGEPGFAAMWDWMGGQERWDRRKRWWAAERHAFAAALAPA
jgi:Phosphotransferase enzyme family